MNFSTMTVSYPIDGETYEEIVALCERAEQTDLKNYKLVLNLQMAKSYEAKGFFVLVYNDEEDLLVGVASAIDMMGLNTYEWSILVDPMYRQIGIGSALNHVLNDGFIARGSEGDLALTVDGGHYGVPFLLKQNYHYSFSEATLESKAQHIEEVLPFTVRPFESKDTQALCGIFSQGFGDTEEESIQLIEFNSNTEGIHLWVAERDEKIIGTVSTRKEGEGHWLTALAVHPSYEGQGIGSQLIRWVKDYVARQQDQYVLLDVEIENERALSIYLKNGFMVASQIHYFVRGL
jgi:mycothiol synthase